uniref:Uncharacterized protein n=1 Tax=Glossina pallidipes TaxID=7398 RepID=A0A1B0ABU1_GLOPL
MCTLTVITRRSSQLESQAHSPQRHHRQQLRVYIVRVLLTPSGCQPSPLSLFYFHHPLSIRDLAQRDLKGENGKSFELRSDEMDVGINVVRFTWGWLLSSYLAAAASCSVSMVEDWKTC